MVPTASEAPLNIRVLLLLSSIALPTSASAAPARHAAVAPSERKPAEQRSLTLVYGDDHVFGVIPPAGWVVDDTSGLGSRLRVVLYPRGQKWSTSPTVMYESALHQDARSPLTLLQMIERDVEAFRKQSPRGSVVAAPVLRTSKGQPAEVRLFSPSGGAPTEGVAYVAEEDLVVLLVLNTRDPALFKRTLPAFNDLVASYQFVSAGVQTPTR